MGGGSTAEETERKRRNTSGRFASALSPPHKKQASAPSPEDKKLDAAMLQFQNQKLAQQLEVHQCEIQALETKFSRLRNKQSNHESNLILIQNAWEQLINFLETLSVRAGASTHACQSSQNWPPTKGNLCSQEETFLCRLLQTGATESSSGCNTTVKCNGDRSVDKVLKSKTATTRILEQLINAIDTQRCTIDKLVQSILKDAGQSSRKIDEGLMAEIQTLRVGLDSLHVKHKELASEVRSCRDSYARDKVEIKRLTGELEETLADLVTNRQKLPVLKGTKESSTSGSMLSGGGGKPLKDTKELHKALDEFKELASQRLDEFKVLEEEKHKISKQLQETQATLKEDSAVLSSRPYLLLVDRRDRLKSESERYQSMMEQMQGESDATLLRQKEPKLKVEIEGNVDTYARLTDLASELQQCVSEKNDSQCKLEEALLASERKDEVTEYEVMVSTLQKEMHMMQQQLDKYKEAARVSDSLRADAESMAELLEEKTCDYKRYLQIVSDEASDIGFLKNQVRLLHESEQELKLILDMYGQENLDIRDVKELKKAESRAWVQVESLKVALDENSLELRVRAANEAEAACQQRLATAEIEIAELKHQLDASERSGLELNELWKIKNEEEEACLAEIETIGQAYEDMQTQNQRLLQQISERDDYNIKLFAESVKAKNLQNSLLEEKRLLSNRLCHKNSSADKFKERVMVVEQQIYSTFDQLAKATSVSREHASTLILVERKSAEVEKETGSMISTLDVVKKELNQRKLKIVELKSNLEKERSEKQKLEEELAALNSKEATLNVHTMVGTVLENLQEEVKMYKASLKCSVCHDRPKEVVITKCYHLFCSQCIQRNLEIRHRKCPGCGVHFGQNDVKNIYI